ncbi:Hypothetical protein NTJ_09365 [Nesidiocoris tenuis]|uniref:Uncharacterized protein n=1 Tax=Nesidiocoris tenuis TaxID=355587 RepID=A0ABN7AYZ0_9HEMI|nr:Hypothetical protein NTJ_09365 [Nesidiocoris tenuis]
MEKLTRHEEVLNFLAQNKQRSIMKRKARAIENETATARRPKPNGIDEQFNGSRVLSVRLRIWQLKE